MNGPQAHHAFRSLDRPTHPREFQSVVDEIPTCAFNYPAADGIALCQADFIPHVLAVPFEIPDDLFEAMAGPESSCLVSICLSPPISLPALPPRSILNLSVTNSLACGLVRLQAHLYREVKVLSRYALQPVTDCNCVAARRGGEQQEVNDQSVGSRTRFGRVIPASLLASGEA